MMEDTEEIKKIIIANKPVEKYFWITAINLAKPGCNEIALHAVDPYMGTVERLIRLWAHFGVEEVEGSRRRIPEINIKTKRRIEVNEIILKKIGAIQL